LSIIGRFLCDVLNSECTVRSFVLTTPIPSKAYTALPKNTGMAEPPKMTASTPGEWLACISAS